MAAISVFLSSFMFHDATLMTEKREGLKENKFLHRFAAYKNKWLNGFSMQVIYQLS